MILPVRPAFLMGYTEDMNYSAIIVAAGSGSRTQLSFNKVLYPWKGKPILELALQRFRNDPDCTQIVLVCAPSEIEDFSCRFEGEKTEFVCGGSTRQRSVLQGLSRVSNEFVLIHDGARPFVSQDLIDRIKAALRDHCSVVPGIPVVDTIKEVDENGLVIRTPKRSGLRGIQTPQAFRSDLVKDALKKAEASQAQVTDDAMAVELFEYIPTFCVDGEASNLKITNTEDLERIHQLRQDG